jgi:hypothetical protein
MLQVHPSVCLFVVTISLCGRVVLAAERINLSPQLTARDLARVSINLQAGGHSLVRTAADGNGQGADQKLPMSVSARLEYDELRLSPTIDANNRTLLALRYYDKADAVLKVDDSGRAPQLAEDRRLIAMESDEDQTMLYSPDGSLLREQLDLIDVVGNSLFVEQLLPADPVANGESWEHDSAVMGPFLALDSVAVCEVKSVLDEYNANFAKMRLAGVVHGMTAVCGASPG